MSRWLQTTLGDVVLAIPGNSKIIKGTLTKENNGILFPAYSATGQDVFSEEFDHEGDGIVVSAVGARCGKCFLATGRWRAIANTHVLLPNKKRVNPRFLWYLINNENFWIKGGTAQPFVKISDSLHNSIPLPPLNEQERIVRILDEAVELRRLQAEADHNTAMLIPSIFHEMFPLSDGASRNYFDATIEQLLEQRAGSIRTGPFGSDLLHSEFIAQGIPVLGIDNVVVNEFRWTEPRCIPESKYEAFKRFRVFPGDVLVTIMGTVGRCAVAPENLPVCMSTKHLCVMSLDRTRLEPHYLWASILFDESVRHQTKIVGSGAIMEGWNSTIIRKLKIRVPSIEKQRAFSARVVEVHEMKVEQAASRKSHDDLFQSVLYRAFQGEL